MNQMTAVEVVDPVDRYTISGTGSGLEGRVHHAAGSASSIEDAVLPYLIASDADLVGGKVVGDPTEGALLVLGHKAGLDIDATPRAAAPDGHAAVRPRLQADGHLPFRERCVRAARGAVRSHRAKMRATKFVSCDVHPISSPTGPE